MYVRNYFISGITELLILSILDAHDSYVYEITKTITENSSGLLNISQNTIYAATYKLQSEGKISEYSKLVGRKRTRVYYHLEQSGKDALIELKQNFSHTVTGVHTIFNHLSDNVKSEDES